MSAQRFTEWQLYEAVEPFGERAQYWRAGQICAAIQNSQRTKRSDPVATAEDFMPKTFSHDDAEASEQPSEFMRMKALQESMTRRSA